MKLDITLRQRRYGGYGVFIEWMQIVFHGRQWSGGRMGIEEGPKETTENDLDQHSGERPQFYRIELGLSGTAAQLTKSDNRGEAVSPYVLRTEWTKRLSK